jgi:hypothetical protein
MLKQTLVRSLGGLLLGSLGWGAIALTPAQAQSPDLAPDNSTPAVETPTNGAYPIRRQDAPLPIPQVYETPIEQFEPPFSDVPRDHWAYEAVTRLFYIGGGPREAITPTQSTPQ